ncbi:hypothetical protein [Amycolatopsis lurida]|uniref:hypothetical protein n=1 Tax=Amycolatopsis lurida TaxID=31959 RepID=UPI0036644EFA
MDTLLVVEFLLDIQLLHRAATGGEAGKSPADGRAVKKRKKSGGDRDPSGNWGRSAIVMIQLFTQLVALGLAIWKATGH